MFFCFLAGLLLKNLESFNNQYNISRDPIDIKFYLFDKYFFKILSHFLLILYTKYSESTYSIVNINNHVRNHCNRGGAYICVCVLCILWILVINDVANSHSKTYLLKIADQLFKSKFLYRK